MRFALLLEALHPRPWAPTGDGRRLRELVDVAVRSEALGFARVWVPERHFQEELGHAGPPEVVLGAIATRTRRLGLGLGPLGAHPHIQHPARLAAAVAALDALSGGRAAVAFAEPRSAIELGPFRIARAGTRAAADRTIELVARLLSEEPFTGEDPGRSGDGEGLPVRQLVPRPQAGPHPTLWRACDRPEDVRAAAEAGLGAFVRAPLEPDEAAEWVAEHRAIQHSARCQPLGAAIETGVAVVLPVHVAQDAATALAEGLDAVHLHRHLVDHHERFGAHRPGRTRAAEEFARRRAETGYDPAPVLAAADDPLALRVGGSLRGAVGDPDGVAALLAAYRDAGVDELVLVPPLGLLDPQVLMRSLELLGTRVLPDLADDEDDDAVEAEDPELRAALARRRPVPVERATVILPRQDGVLDDVPAPPIGVGTVSGAVGGGSARPAGDGASPAGRGDSGDRSGRRGPNGHAPGAPGTPGGPGGPGAPRGPGADGGAAGNGAPDHPAAVRAALGRRGGAALDSVLDRGSSRLVRRTLVSDPALRVVFGGMARALRPAARSGEFRGELQFELVEADGQVAPWTVEAGPLRALARRGPAREPTLTLRLTRDDLLRLVTGRLDAGGAVLDGRLDLEGDLALAVRMGDLFRR